MKTFYEILVIFVKIVYEVCVADYAKSHVLHLLLSWVHSGYNAIATTLLFLY